MKPPSIRLRIFVALAGVIGGFLVLTSLVMDELVDGFVEAEVSGDLDRSRAAYERYSEVRDALLLDKARSLAQAPHLRAVLGTPDVDAATIEHTVRALAEASGSALFFLADDGGRVLVAVPSLGGPSSVAGQPGVPTVAAGGEFCGPWSFGERVSLVAACPVTLGGEVLGILAIGSPLDSAAARDLASATGQDVTVVRGDVLVAHACDTLDCPGQPPGGAAAWRAIDKETQRTMLGGRAFLTSAITLADGTTTLVLSRPLDEALARFRSAERSLLLIGIGIAAVGFLVSRRLSSRIARPIEELRAAAEDLARGELGTRVTVASANEVGILANAFNAMAEHIQHLLVDVTDKARAAEQASEAKSVFLSTMSHELRTPLNAILGFAQVLVDSELSDEQREHLGAVEGSGRELLRLIDDVLEFASLETGTVRSEPTVMNVSAFMDRCLEPARAAATAKGLGFSVGVADGVPERLTGDALRLRQTLEHAAGNAVKFTNEGSVDVRVTLLEQTASDARLRFEVRDTGIGISHEHATRAFQPFSQADGSHSRAFGGTGLGLALVREYVRLMRGECGIDGEQGRGSTFWFTVKMELAYAPADVPQPAKPGPSRAAPAPDPAPAAPLPDRSTESASEGAKRVLIVEDNATNQRLISFLIGRAGYAYGLASNGAECLEQLGREHFDLVLMDCQMPVMDGFAATRAIRARERETGGHVPVIAVTANVQRSSRQACMEAGMDGYLAKPLDPRTLASDIACWLESSRRA